MLIKPRHRPSVLVIMTGVIGLVMEAVAFGIETAMGSGNGPGYEPIHLVQLMGSVLVFLAIVLGLIGLAKGRKSY
jgi:hypothetical protein